MESKKFIFPIRVYYEDTDAGGVVYHARYLHFYERARTEFLRSFDFSQQTLLTEHQIAFVVKSMQIDYNIAARLDDFLNVETEVTEIKGATILFTQFLKKGETLLSTATVKIACVDLRKMKPVALPKEVKTALLN